MTLWMTRRKSYKDLSLYKCKGRITKSFYTADMKSEDMNNFYLFIESNSKTMNNLKKRSWDNFLQFGDSKYWYNFTIYAFRKKKAFYNQYMSRHLCLKFYRFGFEERIWGCRCAILFLWTQFLLITKMKNCDFVHTLIKHLNVYYRAYIEHLQCGRYIMTTLKNS